jgi:hypothetical protein
MQVPLSLLSDTRVQAAALLLLLSGEAWLARRSIEQGETLASIKTIVTNHYAHRFKKVQEILGVEWDDGDDANS